MEFLITLDELYLESSPFACTADVNVLITDYINVAPWAGGIYNCPSDIDFYGEQSIEWKIQSVELLDEDGKELNSCDAIIDEIERIHQDDITEILWEKIDELKERDYY